MPPAQTMSKVKTPVLSPFIRLPIELVNIIFTSAAETSRQACLALCLVASWARQIALPHLFHTLLAGDHSTKFHKYLARPPYIPFNSDINAAALVENVWMPPEGDTALDVFENCHNITHMAASISCFYKLMYSTSPTQITGEEQRITGPALDHNHGLSLTFLGTPSFTGRVIELFHSDASVRSPLYDRVTHLRVEMDTSFGTLHQFSHFSRLSHLSLPYTKSVLHIAKYLNKFLELRSLDMFVVAGVKDPRQRARWKSLEDWVRVMRQEDKRIFFVEIPAIDIQAQWEEEMMGGWSLWDTAFRYTAQWEAEEAKERAKEPESRATDSRDVMPRRSRRNAKGTNSLGSNV